MHLTGAGRRSSRSLNPSWRQACLYRPRFRSSTPLTLAAAENPAFIHHTHFDERGLGHSVALAAKSQPTAGCRAIKILQAPPAKPLSGAGIEAGLTGEKLILLTADRPPELIDCGANRAIRQGGDVCPHPPQTLSLPRPTQDIPRAGWCRLSTMRRHASCGRAAH